MNILLPALQVFVENLRTETISESRRALLSDLIAFVTASMEQRGDAVLHFICTHNSRRSQFAQVWAQTAAFYCDLPVYCFSGGVEVTAFNPRAVQALQAQGFEIQSTGNSNPHYNISFGIGAAPISAFSKLVEDEVNPKADFAAVMTCSHAEENCPFVPGALESIPLRYEDPKAFDDTPEEAAKYLERSTQIATEMFYVFQQVRQRALHE